MKPRELIDRIDGSWIADQAEALVRVPSVTLDEQAVCQLYERQLRVLGGDVHMREVSPGRPNLDARIGGNGDGPTLMLHGTRDTIPKPEQPSGLSRWRSEVGRGTTDTKGGMAAMEYCGVE